jgi:predicted ABC-type transport system involved in lysophospholipase L1 biosynthesis ATPase subunit
VGSEPTQCIYDDEDIRRELQDIQMTKECDRCGRLILVEWDCRRATRCMRCDVRGMFGDGMGGG